MTAIALRDASAGYGGARVVDRVTLELWSGEWLGLIGPNGAGKTTLLRAIAGLVSHEGRILLDGEEVSGLGRRAIARQIAYVPQRPVVPAGMTVLDYVLTGRTPHIAYLGAERPRDVDVARSVLGRLELLAFAERPLGSLSGGELQRAVLGRALAQEAPVLLLDEPTSALDVGHGQQALELLDRLRREGDLTMVTAMHDLTLAGQFADRLVLLDRGLVVAEGSPDGVLTEDVIRRHYAAEVRVLREGGGVVVVPTRRPAT